MSASCASWCVMHADPEWDGPCHGEPVLLSLVERDMGPIEVVVALVRAPSRAWVVVEPADTGGPHLALDAISALRLADAYTSVLGTL